MLGGGITSEEFFSPRAWVRSAARGAAFTARVSQLRGRRPAARPQRLGERRGTGRYSWIPVESGNPVPTLTPWGKITESAQVPRTRMGE